MKKLRIVKMIAFASLAFAALGYGMMWLWNSLIPDLFNGPVIGFLQAIGLLLLAKVLFSGSWHRRGGNCMNHHRWHEYVEESKNAMSPEERERFREQWKQRCGNSWKWRQAATDNASGTKTS